MYNFDLLDQEEIVKIFDEITICQDDKQKKISAVLTNKRLLFFDFVNNDADEILRVGRGAYSVRNKEVAYIVSLDDIESIVPNDYYLVRLKDNIHFEFDNEELFSLLMSNS